MCMRVKAVNKNLIYEPGGITEFARLALNREVGCPHGCRYCYGPASFRVARENWTTSRAKADYLLNLLASVKDREKKHLPRHQVLLEYSGDVYANPNDTLTARTIRILHDSDYGVCVLTKNPTNALKDIMLFDPRIDCLGVSLSTFDEAEIAYWEHDAPHPSTRLAALKEFYSAGIYTWISQEPIISPASSLQVIERTHAYVDHYKSGLMTTRGQRLPDGYYDGSFDWTVYTADFIARCESYKRTWYAKHTLWKFMPDPHYTPTDEYRFRSMFHPTQEK